jgi:transcriptional regulator of acetoin/glycerol metabolism
MNDFAVSLATTPDQAAALLADAVTILYARAQYLTDHGHLPPRAHRSTPAPAVIPEPGQPGDSNHADPPGGERQAAENALWLALGRASEDGYEIAELIRLTGMTRATLYRRLREHARHGHAIQVSRGRWRGRTTGEPSP